MTTEQREIVGMVRDFVEREIIPVAHDLDHDDTYPEKIVAQMKQLGFFGFAIPEQYGGTGLDYATYAMVCEEIARGWMSITGIINTHFIVSFLIDNFGTDEQKQRFLPRMATGEFHGGFSMSEPNCGSDVQAIQTRAIRDNGEYVINGTKMWATNGEHSTVVATLVKTDPDATPAHRGMSCILAEKQYPGFTSSRRIEKLGYKGVETTELVFENNRQPAANLLGEVEGGIKGLAGLGSLLRFQILVTAPTADCGDDQDRAGNEMNRIAVPQLLELIAADLLVNFVK